MNEIVKIGPQKGFVNLAIGDLWSYRELLYFITLRDIQVRYKQTLFGVAWAVLQPLATTAISTLIFTNLVRFENNQVPYPLFALSGWLLWLFFNTSVNNAGNSLISNTNLVTKVYFPRLIIPIGAVLSGLLDFFVGFVLLFLMLLYYGILSWTIILAPLFVFLTVVFSASCGIFFAALNVRFRDVKHALPFLLQILMFCTPVFYSADILSPKWQFLLRFNPLTGILEGFRSAIFGIPMTTQSLVISLVIISLFSIISLIVFKRMENDFADLI